MTIHFLSVQNKRSILIAEIHQELHGNGHQQSALKISCRRNHNFPRISIYCFPKAEGKPSPLVAMAMQGGGISDLDGHFHMAPFYNKEYF